MLNPPSEYGRLVNFKGAKCMDFTKGPATIVDWDDDAEVLNRIMSPVRDSTVHDRCTRHTGRELFLAESPLCVDLARALKLVADDLTIDDIITDETKEKLDALLPAFKCLCKVFYEAHCDWDKAIWNVRAFVDNITGMSKRRQQVYTMADGGEGSTAKGLQRALNEKALGTNNGDSQRGYVAVLTQGAIMNICKKEAPSEQTANLDGCAFAFADEIESSKKNPLSATKLRGFSGGNSLTAARKCKGEVTFDFDGSTFILCNELWYSDLPMKGADVRRHQALEYNIHFSNNPNGPNQRQKDSTLKLRIADLVPEYLTLVLIFAAVPWPYETADQLLPMPPAVQIFTKMLVDQNSQSKNELEHVGNFIDDCLKAIPLGEAPCSCDTINDKFAAWCIEQPRNICIDSGAARRALMTKLEYKPAYSFRLAGKKSSKNVWKLSNVVMTLK